MNISVKTLIIIIAVIIIPACSSTPSPEEYKAEYNKFLAKQKPKLKSEEAKAKPARVTAKEASNEKLILANVSSIAEEKVKDESDPMLQDTSLKPYKIRKETKGYHKENPSGSEQKTVEKVKDKADPKAQELLLHTFKEIKETESYHFEGKITTETFYSDESPETQEIIINGFYLNPNYYVKCGLIIEEERPRGIEIYRIKREVVVKQDNGEWEQHSLDSKIASNLDTMSPLYCFINICENYLAKENFLGKETLGDKNCQIVIASLSTAGLDRLKKDMQGDGPIHPFGGIITAITDPLWKIWVCEKDLLPYKYVFSITEKIHSITEEENAQKEKWEMSVKISAQFNIFDYDKDTEFEIPPEVKKLLEKK